MAKFIWIVFALLLNLSLISNLIHQASANEIEAGHNPYDLGGGESSSNENVPQEDLEEESYETSHLNRMGPSEIEAYLNKRAMKQGFNSWAGKRSFSAWAGKRNFNAWAGKRGNMMNSWAGKRNLKSPFYKSYIIKMKNSRKLD